jgi:hypothetical protein
MQCKQHEENAESTHRRTNGSANPADCFFRADDVPMAPDFTRRTKRTMIAASTASTTMAQIKMRVDFFMPSLRSLHPKCCPVIVSRLAIAATS